MTTTTGNFSDFLKRHIIPRGEKKTITHTRIGYEGPLGPKIWGGAYHIPSEDMDDFYRLYYHHIYSQGKQEYLTEAQLKDGSGPILIDIDFRYEHSVQERKHTEDHILDLLYLYLEGIKKLLALKKEEFPIYVLEKEKVNVLADGSLTKDGIHIIIGIQMDHTLQTMLREMILADISTTWSDINDLIINEDRWNGVLDDGISNGYTNWQLICSRKPHNQAYQLTQYHLFSFDEETGEFESDGTTTVKSFDMKRDMYKLSARYDKHPKFEINDGIKDDYNRRKGKGPSSGGAQRPKIRISTEFRPERFTSSEQIEAWCDKTFAELSIEDYIIKETHDYTMILDENYYNPYHEWLKVGMALRETDTKLFPTWLLFSAKSPKFKFENISDMWKQWQEFADHRTDNPVSVGSIRFWARKCNEKKYIEVKDKTVDHHINETIKQYTDYDVASVLYALYKDRFVCASIKNNIWFEFKDHRWHEIDSGVYLRQKMSKELHPLYVLKAHNLTQTIVNGEAAETQHLCPLARKTAEICNKLKQTTTKNNIMKEAKEIFYDSCFLEKIDTNQYLMCFKNGIYDFKEREFRDGRPEDYMGMCTNIAYRPLEFYKQHNALDLKNISEFIEMLFPDASLRQYMWEHLASSMIGTQTNQTFNIYTGTGANGKSKLVELMTHVLGDYKGTVPVTLITQKRNTIGSTSSEVAQLIGKRYAVMQEPSKGDRINEGIMKEITGGDPIQARALFKDSITFTPQFNLVVCINELFDIPANDDGTWRRIRVVDYMSKFIDRPYETPEFPREDYPYQYEVDRHIDEKFQRWCEPLASMLVEIAAETQGVVKDCDIVKAKGQKYREGQDYFTGFVNEKIIKSPGDKLMKTVLQRAFKEWYVEQIGKNPPKGRELDAFMEKKFGAYKNGYQNIRIMMDSDDISGNII